MGQDAAINVNTRKIKKKKKKIISFAIRVWNFFKFFHEFAEYIQLIFYEIFIESW